MQFRPETVRATGIVVDSAWVWLWFSFALVVAALDVHSWGKTHGGATVWSVHGGALSI